MSTEAMSESLYHVTILMGADVADAEKTNHQVPKAADLVARRLRSEIVRGEAPAGEALAPEAELMARFGVSRPTLRAALHILETEALVEVRRGSRGGVWVRSPSVDVTARRAAAFLQYHRVTLDDVHRARGLVEPPAVGMLARRKDPTDIAALERTLAEEHDALGDREAVRLVGERFHSQIVELAGNHTLIVFTAMLAEIIDTQTSRHQAENAARGAARRAPRMHGEHEQVIALIKAGAATDAELFWRTHLDNVRQSTSRRMGETVLDLMG
jgi:DNA-binding FadR family transcriptional regulator